MTQILAGPAQGDGQERWERIISCRFQLDALAPSSGNAGSQCGHDKSQRKVKLLMKATARCSIIIAVVPSACVLLVFVQTLEFNANYRPSTTCNALLGSVIGIHQTPGSLHKHHCHLSGETRVQRLCAASYDTWILSKKHWTNSRQHRSKWKEVCSTWQTWIEVEDQHLGQGEDKSHSRNQQCQKNELVLDRAHQPPQTRPMDLACHHLETIRQETTARETSQAVERRPRQILERHDMAEESTRQANLEMARGGLRPTTGHYGCPMMSQW